MRGVANERPAGVVVGGVETCRLATVVWEACREQGHMLGPPVCRHQVTVVHFNPGFAN